MEILTFLLHIDQHLSQAIAVFGAWTYVVLFAVIFVETGLIVAPFLPGDSLLFSVGALAGAGFLDIWIAYGAMFVAAVLGDTVNYWIGHHVGPRVFAKEGSKFFNKEYLEKTRVFYQKHGGKAVVLGRFLPIIRTFVPFVAGVGRMDYRAFLFYNVLGAFIWATLFTFAGYFFGGIPVVRAHFEYVILGIVALSFVPLCIEYGKYRYQQSRQQ